jgi:hypothetical protein
MLCNKSQTTRTPSRSAGRQAVLPRPRPDPGATASTSRSAPHAARAVPPPAGWSFSGSTPRRQHHWRAADVTPLERPTSSLPSRTPCFSGGDPVVGLFGGSHRSRLRPRWPRWRPSGPPVRVRSRPRGAYVVWLKACRFLLLRMLCVAAQGLDDHIVSTLRLRRRLHRLRPRPAAPGSVCGHWPPTVPPNGARPRRTVPPRCSPTPARQLSYRVRSRRRPQ